MNKVLKRVGMVVGALFALFVLVALLVPLFVHVDNYRPQIVSAVNEKINGKLELGKLSLSLWGQVKVEVDGFTLNDAQGRKVVAAQNVYFHIPLFSLLTASPVVTFRMIHPEVNVIKDKNGTMNVLTLMKPSAPTAGAPAPTPTPAPGESKPSSLPAIASRARMGVELRDALVQYRDEATQLTSTTRDLNVQVKDISMSHPTQLLIWADLDTTMGKTMTVKGPARITGQAQPVFNGGVFESASGDFKVDLDGLVIEMPGLFEKKKGMAANASGKFAMKGTEASLTDLAVRFFNAEILGAGGVSNLGAASGPSIKVEMKSNEIPLHPWNELSPMLKTYDLGGTASLSADASGTLLAPQYHALLAVKALTAKAPMLKAQPRIDAHVKVVTDQVEEMKMTLTAPGNDLTATGKVVHFAAPKIDVQVVSKEMDLDQLIDMPKKTAAKAPAKGSDSSEAGKAGAPTDIDASLQPLRENEALAGMNANFGFRFGMFKAQGVKITDWTGQASFKNLVLSLDSFKMKVFNGTVDAVMGAQLKPRTPTYHFRMGVNGIDLKEAVAAEMDAFKNTLLGKATFKMEGTGSSFNPEPAKKNLNAKGNFSVVDASFGTLDIGKMVTEALNKSVQDAANKVPALKGQHLNPPGAINSKYKEIAANFTIANGQFVMPDFNAKSEHGIDFKGDTRVGLVDNSLKASWQIIDTYDVTGARKLAVEQQGVRVEHILASGNDPVSFPVQVGGTIFAPKPDYGAVPEALGKVVMGNVSNALQGKAKAELQKAAEDQLKKAGAPKQLQDLGKKLFGH